MRILLTGATGGIGAALARAFAYDGHALLLQGRNEARLDELKAELGETECTTVSADLNDHEGRDRLAQAAEEFLIDTLCNNAGVNQFAAFEQTDIAPLIHTNVTATMQLTQILIPTLLTQPSARILIIGSAFGAIGFPGYSAYCASKFALRGFAEALGREYADTPLKVHYFAPRATATTMNDDRVRRMNAELGTSSDTPWEVATTILAALKKDKPRLQLGFPERMQTRLNALLPGIVDKALGSQLPIIKRYLLETSHD
jgi:short-subunit dehydrogenase